MIYPNGAFANYVYDNAHRLLEIATEDSKGKLLCSYSYTHDKVGNRLGVGEPDESGWNYFYDKAYQLTGAVAYKKGKPRFAIEYAYDPAGNRLGLDLGRFTGNDLKPLVSVEYEYNEADELLKSVTTGADDLPVGWEEAYTYDKNGNTISKVGTLTRPGSCFVRAGEITKWLWTAGNDGNIAKWLEKKSEGEAWQRSMTTTYEWDYEDMLTKVNLPALSGVEGPCDRQEEYWNCTCRTKRVAKRNADGVYRQYAFDPLAAIEHILIEYDEAGVPVARYTLGPRVDEIVSKKDLLSGETVFYHYEGLGSVVALTDEKGHKKAEYKYTPFGAPLDWKNHSKVENWYTFTGRYHDEHTGLRYHRARYVDPRIGRWLSRDPSGEYDGGVNVYGFVLNNPIELVDTLGDEVELPTPPSEQPLPFPPPGGEGFKCYSDIRSEPEKYFQDNSCCKPGDKTDIGEAVFRHWSFIPWTRKGTKWCYTVLCFYTKTNVCVGYRVATTRLILKSEIPIWLLCDDLDKFAKLRTKPGVYPGILP